MEINVRRLLVTNSVDKKYHIFMAFKTVSYHKGRCINSPIWERILTAGCRILKASTKIIKIHYRLKRSFIIKSSHIVVLHYWVLIVIRFPSYGCRLKLKTYQIGVVFSWLRLHRLKNTINFLNFFLQKYLTSAER